MSRLQKGCLTCAEQVLVACRKKSMVELLVGPAPNDAVSAYAKERSQGSRPRASLREMRLQDALFLHRTGEAGLRPSRL